MKYARGSLSIVSVLTALLLAGCGDDETSGLLVVNGSSQGPPAALSPAVPKAPIGDPSSWLVGLYSFHISENADCSGPFFTAFDNGSSPLIKDFTTDPELFREEDVPTGTYPCVAMRISDVIEFQSTVSGGACVAGVTYRGDVYRVGGEPEPFRDLSLTPIPATGTDAAPSDDRIYIFFSTSRSAATARGLANNQVAALTSPLVVPDAVTFHWDATNAVFDNDTSCSLEPENPGLFF